MKSKCDGRCYGDKPFVNFYKIVPHNQIAEIFSICKVCKAKFCKRCAYHKHHDGYCWKCFADNDQSGDIYNTYPPDPEILP